MASKSASSLLRWVTLPLGMWMLASGLADEFSLRAKYVSSSPGIGASLGSLPSAVSVRFGAELDPSSELSVYATGPDVWRNRISSDEAFDPNDSERRALIVPLRPMPRRVGTYRVDWRTKAKGGRDSHGHFYFAVGMPTPSHLEFFEDDLVYIDDTPPHSLHPGVIAGLAWIAIGLLAPALRDWSGRDLTG